MGPWPAKEFFADGVVVGSVLVNLLAQHQMQPQQGCEQIITTLAHMRIAMDSEI